MRIKTPLAAHDYRNTMASELELYGRYYSYEKRTIIEDQQLMRLTARMIRNAPLVLWREDLFRAAIAGAELFVAKPYLPDLVRPAPQLWVPEVDMNFNHAAWGLPSHYGTAMVFLGVKDDGLLALTLVFAAALEELPDQIKSRLRAGDLSALEPHLVSTLLCRPGLRGETLSPILAALHFMNLEIANVERQRLPRPTRRLIEREGRPEPDIRVVTLRRKKAPTDHAPRDVDWSCRWIVGGHWRNQWYPAAQEHRPVYVVPYVKGPEDKPLKTDTAAKVYQVVR